MYTTFPKRSEMLKYEQPNEYSLGQALAIIEKISKYINDNPFTLQQVGVFRESGTLSHSKEIVDHLLKNEKFHVKKYSVHDYIGALKNVLINTPLFETKSEATLQLKGNILAQTDEEASRTLKAYIEQLGKSPNENEKMASKIVTHYLRLLSHALLFEHKNMMSSSNLGIVAGPFFANHLEDDPRKIVALSLKLNGVADHLLRNSSFTENEIAIPKSKMVLFLSKKLLPTKTNLNNEKDKISAKFKNK